MKSKVIFLFLTAYSLCKDMPNKALLSNNHIFALVCIHEDGKGGVCNFEISDLLKSKFPQGPIRYNKINDKKNVDVEKIRELEKNSWELPMLCVEERGIGSKVKCGFESLDHNHLAYVFSLSHDIKEVRGFIILRTLYDSIVHGLRAERNTSEDDYVDFGDTDSVQETSYEEDELDAMWDEEPPALAKEQPSGFLERLYINITQVPAVQKSSLWLIMKYFEIKKRISTAFSGPA